MHNLTDLLTDELILELEELLIYSFSKKELNEAIALSEKVMITDVSHDEYEINIIGKIANSKYEPSIVIHIEDEDEEDDYDYDDDYKIEPYCNCDTDYFCVHIGALVKSIMDNAKTQNEKESKAGRIISINEKLNFKQRINKLLRKQKKYDSYYFKDINLVLEGENSIVVNAEYSYYFIHEEPDRKMKFLATKHNDFLTFQCKTCKAGENEICEHLNSLLDNYEVCNFLQSFLLGEISYNTAIEKYSEIHKIPQETLKEKFEIVLNKNVYNLRGKNFQWLGASTFESLNKKIEQKSVFDLNAIEKNEQKLIQKVGVLWERNKVNIIKGNSVNKHPNQLTSVKFDNSASGSNRQVNTLIAELYNLSRGNDQFAESRAFLSASIELLNSFPKYATDAPQYHHTNIRKSDLIHFEFSTQKANLYIDVDQDEVFITLKFSLRAGNQVLQISNHKFINEQFIIIDEVAYILENDEAIKLWKEFSYIDEVKSSIEDANHLFEFLNYVSKVAKVNISKYKLVHLAHIRKQLHIREVGNFIIFEPSLVNEDIRINVFDKFEYIDHKNQSIYKIDEHINESYITELKQLHPSWNLEFVPQKYFYLIRKDLTESTWFLDFFSQAAQKEIDVFGQEKLSKLKFNTNRPKINANIKSGIDWFDASVEMKYGDILVSQDTWFDAIKNNEKFIKLNDGTLGVLPEEWLKKLKKLVAISEKNGEDLKISKLRFNVIDELFDTIDDASLKAELNEKKAALENYVQNKKYTLPSSINAELRPYQLQGYQWLKFLDEYNFGGCLADDMGLGKTLQVISLLADQKKSNNGTSLVVVPKSLMFNWAAELEKFAPELVYLIYHGATRAKEYEQFQKYDIIISTYDTIARDVEDIKNIRFNYIVLDESQAIKNVQAQRYKAMRLLQSRNKLAMTGTPIENNTFDLYAQFSFINPGLMGSQKSFADHFSTPIDAHANMDALGMLKKIIHPFLLRRTKEVVAKDLPEKTESIIYCEMGKEQRKLYDSLREKIKQDVNEKINESGIQNSKFKILEGLLRLRQLCNSPELVDSKLPEKKKESAKLNTLIDLLTEELGNHKALVFSQFVTMLDLIKRELDKKGVKYAYLDGSTVDRGGAVNDFMEDDSCQIFLLSLKAGNTGLNLTKADYVYVVDPWWNPAVEAQAIDRTHRIGQTNNIFAYKMICKDTIEEKIVHLQSKKKKLAQDLIQADENVFKSLTKDELMSLFD